MYVSLEDQEPQETDLAALIRMQNEIADLREANRNLQRKMLKSKSKNEELVQAAYEGAKDALVSLGRPIVTKPPAARKDTKFKSEQVALFHSTDWQMGKETTTYNSQVGRERIHRFFDKSFKIIDMHRTVHRINKAVILFGGDHIEGCMIFPKQPYEIDSTVFTQFVNTSRLMEEVVRKTLSVFDEVEVIAEWGNHGATGSRRDSVPRSDNYDRMCFHLARETLRDEHRLKWEDSPNDIQRVEIGNYRALLCHADEIGRNGFASPMTIVRHADRWASGAYPWDFKDLFIGHFHTHNEWAMANGRGTVYQTGSPESSNRYAMETLAASAVPSQRLHLVDPVEGRTTAQYKVYVDK